MARAGEFPKVVMIQNPTESASDNLGHSVTTFTDLVRCAARVWTRSSGEQSFAPAEFAVGSIRLLLRLPPRALAVGWGIKFETELFKVVDIEHRGNDRLLTLEPR